MKKVYMILLAALALASMPVSAEGLADTQTVWAKQFTNSGSSTTQSLTTQGGGMALTTDGDIIAVANVSATSATENILFGSDVIAAGTDYSGNSANQGLVITKVKADGSVAWTVASTNGEVAANENRVVTTADGGAVVLTNMRHSEGHLDQRVNIKDASGQNYELAFDVDTERAYRGLVIKLNADGAIEWVRELAMTTVADATTYPKWSQASRNIGQGVATNALLTDNEGNIFVAGRMVAAMTVDGITIEPHNVDTWTGASSATVGNMFVLKLDADGKYVGHLVSEGKATQEAIQDMQLVGNDIYLFGWVTGIKDTEFSLGGKAATPSTTNPGIALACIDTDLNVEVMNFFESTISGSAWQMPTINVINGKVYLSGTAKFGIDINGTNYTNTPSNKARQSWLIQFDAATCQPTAATVLATGPMQMQHGFFGVYEGADAALYAIERGLTPSASFGSEMILYKLNATTLAVEDQATLATASCDGNEIIARGTRLYVMNRFGNKNEAISFINSDITAAYAAFTAGISAFQVPETAAGVESIAIDGESEITIAGPTSLSATLLPENMTNKDVVWTSSNDDAISVDQYGLVTPVAFKASSKKRAPADNSAIITATSAANPNVKASVVVTYDTTTGVSDVKIADNNVRNNNVYTIDGRIVRQGTIITAGLPAGLYIAGGKKVIVK